MPKSVTLEQAFKAPPSEPIKKSKKQPTLPLATQTIQNTNRTSTKPIKSSPFKGFARIISLIWKAVIGIFKTEKKKNQDLRTDHTISSSAEMTIAHESFLDIALSLNKASLQAPKKVVNNEPMQLQKEREKSRKKARKDLYELSFTLNQIDKKNQNKNGIVPRGQINLGNTCHLNAALQCVEAAYGHDEECLRLIEQDLTRKPKETMAEMEERILKEWMPIPNLDLEKVEELQARQEEIKIEIAAALKSNNIEATQALQEQLSILSFHTDVIVKRWAKAKNDLEQAEKDLMKVLEIIPLNGQKRDALLQTISDLKFDLLEREDKILFKWSYLLLLQAKTYGSDEDVRNALKIHHHIVFMIERHNNLMMHNGPNKQHDSAYYFELWHTILGKEFNLTSFRTAIKNGVEVRQIPRVEPMPIFPVAFHGNSFCSSLFNEFDRKNENSKVLANLTKEKAKQEGLLNKVDDQAKDADKKRSEIITKIEDYERKIRYIDKWNDHSNTSHLDFDEHYRFPETPPDVLNFQIKRFSYVKNQAVKDGRRLPYDLDDNKKATGSYTDILNLDRYFKEEYLAEGCADYQLVSFVKHSGGGSADSGHYISYICRENKWFKCDDDKVLPVKTSEVPFQEGYIFSYKRIQQEPV